MPLAQYTELCRQDASASAQAATAAASISVLVSSTAPAVALPASACSHVNDAQASCAVYWALQLLMNLLMLPV